MVQPVGWAVQLHWGALQKQVFGHNGDKQYSCYCIKRSLSDFLNLCLNIVCGVYYTCVMEPPGLVEEMSGGGSGIVRGLTAASLPLSCGRPESEGWPACWNAGRQKRL